MEAFLSYGFLQRALLAGIFVAVACALLGVFLILRRDAMIGHGLAHVAFAGVALGILIMKIKEKAGLYGDTAIAIFSSVGFALGLLFVTFAHRFNVDLFSYLFGEILAIEAREVWLSVGLAVVVVLIVVINYHQFMYMTFDRESAKVAGIKVNRLDVVLTMLTAITVVLAMKIVGLILVAALVVIPAAAGLQLAANFKQAIVISSLVSVTSVVFGLFLAFYIDLPASATIVILAFLIFALFFFIKRGKRLS